MRLLVSTYGGIQLYDRSADLFTKKLDVVTDDGNIKVRPVARIMERKNGDILLLTDDIARLEKITYDVGGNTVEMR